MLLALLEDALKPQLQAELAIDGVGALDESECPPQPASIWREAELRRMERSLGLGKPFVYLLPPQV